MIIDLYKKFYTGQKWKNLESIAKYAEVIEMRFKGDTLSNGIIGFRGPLDLSDFDAFFKANDIAVSKKLQNVLELTKGLGFGMDLGEDKDTNNLKFYFIDCGMYDTTNFEQHIDQDLKRDILRLSFDLNKDRITGSKIYRRVKKAKLADPDVSESKLYVFSINDEDNIELVAEQTCKTNSENINNIEFPAGLLEHYESVDQSKYKLKKSFRENTNQFYLRITDCYK